MSLDMFIRRPGAEPAEYEKGDGKFTIKVNHGGTVLEVDGLQQYVGGQVTYFEHCVKETLSIVVLDKMAYLLDYRKYVGYYWRVSDLYANGGWKFMITDDDVIAMATYAEETRFVEVFFKHVDGTVEFEFIKYLELDGEGTIHRIENVMAAANEDVLFDEAEVVDFTAPEFNSAEVNPVNHGVPQKDIPDLGANKGEGETSCKANVGEFSTPPQFCKNFPSSTGSGGKKKGVVTKKRVIHPVESTGTSEDDEDDYECRSLVDSDYEEDDNLWQEFVDEGLEDFDKHVEEEVRRQYSECPGTSTARKNLKRKLFIDVMADEDSWFEDAGLNFGTDSEMELSEDELKEGEESSDEEPLVAPRVVLKKKKIGENETEMEEKSPLKSDDYPVFRADRDMLNPKFEMGMLFSSKQIFQLALVNYGIKQSLDLKITKNDRIRIYVVCVGKNCKWKLHCNKVSDGSPTFQIRLLGPNHTCATTMEHKLASTKYIAKRYLADFRSQTGVVATEFQAKVETELNVKISINKVYKIKSIARALIEGSYKDQYKLLYDYLEELKRSNPGTSCYMEPVIDELTGQEMFSRLYVCLGAIKEGFRSGCRKVVGLDGTFLKGSHPGTLLTAVGIDANNGVYPLAYAVVDSETTDSWTWFIKGIKYDLGMVETKDWCIISDRQKGLGVAVADELPNAEHRHCLRHIHCNFKKLHPGIALRDQVWRCGKATYIRQFETEFEKLKGIDEAAHTWFVNHTHPVHWTRSHFRIDNKCDHLLNNHCETFNRHLLSARAKPILGMLESIRVYMMLNMQARRQWAEKYTGDVCPRIMSLLEKKKTESRLCLATFSGGNLFEVKHGVTQEQFVVNTQERTCSCRGWELSGIPCAHAVSALSKEGRDVADYVDKCYGIEAFKKAYAPIIGPANGPNNWPRSDKGPLLPPNKLRQTGRPQLNRRLEQGEKGTRKKRAVPTTTTDGRAKLSRACLWVGKCGTCKKTGHNQRKCPEKMATVGESSSKMSQNMNRCSKCLEFGHNKRSCSKNRTSTDDPTVDYYSDIDEMIAEDQAQMEETWEEYVVEETQPFTHEQPPSETISQQNEASTTRGTKKKREPFKCGFCQRVGHTKASCAERKRGFN